MSIDDDRQISPFVSDRLPEFVRIDHPTLVAFLEAYYEWLGLRRDSGLVMSPLEMHNIPDVDTSLDQFIERFKSQYLFNFPETLAISKQTGMPVDVRRLIKNIKQFYLAKGTEKSYEFLFRILYDTNVEFYYPKKDILRLSSGRWTQNNYLRISNSLGDQIYRSPGNLLIQKDANGSILATARVVDVNVMQIDNFDVAELLITGRNGTFQTGDLGVEFSDGADTFKEVRVFSVVSTVDIINGGTNYQVGERVEFVSNTGDGGQRAHGTIVEVDAVGSVRKINIDDYGINYTNPPSIVIETARGTGFQGSVTVGSLCQSFGFYMDNDGRLSTNKVLQDNHYYQNWSYVLKAEVVIDNYRELIRKLVHPVGIGMFGSVLIKRCSRANLDNASALMSFRIPYIGNYTPYTFQTFDDLSLWFQESITGGMTASGYSANAHDDLLKGVGNGSAPIGNPISNNVPFKEAQSGWLSTPGFPNADPFWIIYPHANKQVDGGYHYARIWKSQTVDFLHWPEWSYNQTDRTNFSEFSRIARTLNSTEYSEYVKMLNEGGVAGGNTCPCTQPECDTYLEGDPPPCNGELRLIPGQGVGGSDCCCCDGEVNQQMGVTIQKCVCEGGQFTQTPNGFECTCPAGYNRIESDSGCGFVCVKDGGGGGGGGGGGPTCEELGCDPICERCVNNGGENWCAPECNPDNLGICPCTNCSPLCADNCCLDGSCPPCFGCNNPDYFEENCCECAPGSKCCPDTQCDPNDPNSNCCFEDPCTQLCASFCSNFPSHPYCVNRCTFFPCCPGCTAQCNPECPQFDPCLTSCPNFDYCVTGVSGWSNTAIENRAANCPQYGPCYDGPLPYGYEPCFDKCTATGCSGYDPCHADCPASQDPCGVTCPDACLCNSKCNQSCPNFSWCVCDPTGPTCCELQPCQLGCNPDFCDPSYANGQCFNPCDPSCTPDFCNPSNEGFDCYRPCHPDCNPNNCNPLCPGFDRCNFDCPNWDRDFCCQGCNCGDGGDVGDPVYRDIDGAVRRWQEDNGFGYNPNDNLCNNDISRCYVGPHSFDHNASLGALLRYNENSEFRKITLRSFFNMPVGDAFDCREERIARVAVPKFVVMSPKSGTTIYENRDSNRPLTIEFRITNQENIAYYNIAQANVYIDNRLRSTISINARELTITGIEDGRRTLKMEMIDVNGRLVQGTQEIVIFGYQYSQTSRSQATTQRASIDDSLQESGLVYGIFAGMNGGISFPTLASTTVGGPTVEEGSVVIGGGPDPSLNMGGRRDMSCRVPCDNQYLEDQRITENIYESLRNDNKSDFDRCLRDVRDGGTLRRLYEGWLQGGDAGGLLPKGEPVNIPLVECCVPPPPEDPSQPEGVPCPSASREGLCIDDFPPEYCIDDDSRKKVYEWFERAHRCKVEMCYGNLGYDGQSLRNGGPPPFNGPNWCIDDTQKQIDDAINDMKRVLCVERACNGPVSENCPNKHYTLVEICRLEALKRLRCGLFDAYRDFNAIECSLLQDAAQEMAKAHRTHCNGVPPIENPCGNNDLGWDTPIEENAIIRCRVRIREKEREMFDRVKSDFAEVRRSLTNQWKGLQATYDAEVIACGCSGQDVPDDIYPTLYPHWYDARRIGRDPSSYPDYWADPLGNGRWYPGKSNPTNADRQRFWGQEWPNWLPLPGREGFGY